MFESHNLYQHLNFIEGENPQALVNKIRRIKTPMKIIAIIQNGDKHVCYFISHFKIKLSKDMPKAKVIK